jgi:hypothetical protein
MEKNIFVLPTENPSKLYKSRTIGYVLYDEPKTYIFKNQGQNIYITSSEKPKEGEYGLGFAEGTQSPFIFKHDGSNVAKLNALCENTQKIIITNDEDLIKNGVQAIDDEFLEFFVKNPSCKEVEVYDDENITDDGLNIYSTYKIIIPKEESKQDEYTSQDFLNEITWNKSKKETLGYLQVCKDCGSEEVARCKWVNVNTEEIYSADSGTTLEWCFDCKSETNIIDKEDYE